jgi:hypothetical protein
LELRKRLDAGQPDIAVDRLFGRVQRVMVSVGKIQIYMRGKKRPVGIPWTPKPKDEMQVQFAPSETSADPKLIKAIVRAQAWLGQLSNGQHSSIEKLAAAAGYNPKVIRQGLRLAFLPPELVKAALNNAASVKLKHVPKLLPLSWQEQQRSIG